MMGAHQANQPRRILFLMNEALFFVSHRLPLGIAARELGYEVHIAAPYWKEYTEIIRAHGLHFHDIPLDRGSRRIGGEIALIRAFRDLLRELRPDLIHAVTMKPVLYGGALSRLMGAPAVVHAVTGLGYLFLIEGLGARLQRAVIKRLYRFALGHRNACAIFQNPDDRALFVDAGLVEPAVTVMIKGCGVDLQQFAPRAEAAPEDANEPVVMFPARIQGNKGVHEFVAAARILKRDGIGARFVLVGRTDAKNPTNVDERIVRGWEADGLVEWWGYSDDMPATLPRAHIVCMPSYREGLPRVLIEAAACGRPIVTADVPGCREVVRDSASGILVPVKDGPATAAAIRQLIEDPALRRRMGAEARALAEAEFSVEDFVGQTMAAFEAVLATQRTAS